VELIRGPLPPAGFMRPFGHLCGAPFGLLLRRRVEYILCRMSLVIFGHGAGKDGQNTLMFGGVEDFADDGVELSFTYFGKSTQVKRRACFSKAQISGYALELPA